MTVATEPNSSVDTQRLLLDVSNTKLTVTPAQFDRLCTDNPNLRLELTQNRELIVMAPAGGESIGLLINPKNKQVEIYRQRQEIEILESPMSIDCGDIMPGFVLSMTRYR